MAFLISGCVGVTGSGSGSNLTANSYTVSFGDVETGSTSTQSVTVTNSGAVDVSVRNISVAGPGFSTAGLPSGATLAPGDTANLALIFAPTSAGKVTGTITVDEELFPTPLRIAVSGNGVASGAHAVMLTWNASTSNVTGYRAYRATSPGGPYTLLNSSPTPQLRYTDSTVQSGTTYYYVVTAVAAGSSESDYSNQASVNIPKS
jgi:hypothetical protein